MLAAALTYPLSRIPVRVFSLHPAGVEILLLSLLQFSIAFPSGKRRASILTSSLELRLGPKLPKEKVPQVVVEDSADGCGDRISASDASESLGLVRY